MAAAAASPSRRSPLGDVGVDLAVLRRPRDVLPLDERLDPLLDHHRGWEESRLQLGGDKNGVIRSVFLRLLSLTHSLTHSLTRFRYIDELHETRLIYILKSSIFSPIFRAQGIRKAHLI